MSNWLNGRGRDSSSRMRTGSQQLARDLEGGHGLFSRDGRKVVEESLERVAGGEVINEVLEGHARTRKNGGSTQHVGVASDNRFQGGCRQGTPSVPCYLQSRYGA